MLPGVRTSRSSRSATFPWPTACDRPSRWWTIPLVKSGAWPQHGSWSAWPSPGLASSASRYRPGSLNAAPGSYADDLQHGCCHRNRHRDDLVQGSCPIDGAARAAESAWGPVRVRGIGVTGLGESGVLLDAAGRPAAPAIAWFDHRGAREMEQAGREFAGFAARFEGRTGLPWSTQPTIAKLLWLRNNGVPAGPASTWLNVPEWIVLGLGGDLVREPSLASRTGLIDQDTGEAWPDALAVAGLPAGILPAERLAGSPAGNLRHDGVVSCAAGAVLTVAGHDHPVAAIGVGAVEADELFNSSGTADVLTRSIPGTLDETHRQRS